MTFEEIARLSPYSLDKAEKKRLLTARLTELTEYHKKNCPEYSKILDSISYDEKEVSSYVDLPFLPVRLFKERALKSVSNDEIVKTMTSSGTSGQRTSKIYLDRTTSANQQKAMVKIVSEFTGSSRMPMIIIDCPSVIKDRTMFSARGAGILGFSIFGSKKMYALDDDMQLNLTELRAFLETHRDRRILLFGFTFMIWQHFYHGLVRLREETGETIDLSNAVLIHGGGWKKLVSEAVSPEKFHNRLKDICGLDSIHDYYGMVEQTGCIYMQCGCGHLHASVFSDVIVRRATDFSVADTKESGIIQVVSTIPESYPGHSLLTEDVGVILGEDDCPCGRKGKYFKILGRLNNAEIRGCSDTYAAGQGNGQTADEESTADEALEKVSFLVGSAKQLLQLPFVPAKAAFDESTLEFLNALSSEILRSPEAKRFSDVISFGFWLRRASTNALKKRFTLSDGEIRIGRGVAFHVAPSNVPVNYAYSLVSGLLCGNANVVRVPSKNFPQISIINTAITSALEQYPEMKNYVCLVRYGRDHEVNRLLSALCDVRIIWGGDVTIDELRKSALLPRATEITFADRYSLAVIDSDEYMESEQKDKLVFDFYNDTYLSDQNACTSPRVVVWHGKRKGEARELFWSKLHTLAENRYPFQSIMAVDKLTQKYLAAMAQDKIGIIQAVPAGDNILVRIQVSKLTPALMEYRGNCGYFYEMDTDDIMEIRDFCNDTHCQTIGVIGSKEFVRPLVLSGIKGVDRVVPVGHTMDFDLDWDGYNLVERLTRTVVL